MSSNVNKYLEKPEWLAWNETT